MPVSPLVNRAIEVAADKLGIDGLARRLNVPASLITAWQQSEAMMSRHHFMELVEVLLELKVDWSDWEEN